MARPFHKSVFEVQSESSHSAGDRAHAERLPVSALLPMAMTGFTAILTETLPAGLLPQIAQGLSVSPALAGQSVTAYAAGSLMAAIPLMSWTQGFRRKPVLLAAIGGFLICNTLTAIATSFAVMLVARFLAGVAAGLAWGMLAGYARRLVSPALAGRALAVAMAGTPVALSFGVPSGTLLGVVVGWRAAFLAMSLMTLALIVWTIALVPDAAGQPASRRQSAGAVLWTPGIRPIMLTVLAWMAGHNILYTYIAPFAALAGLQSRTGAVLLTFGVAALLGIWITGLLVDRMLRRLVLGSLALFLGAMAVLGVASANAIMVFLGVFAWGASFGGAATQLQTAAGDAAGDGVDLANAINTTVWNGAIAAGGVVGGVLLGHFGARALPPAVFLFAAVALATTIVSRDHAFRPGPRAAA